MKSSRAGMSVLISVVLLAIVVSAVGRTDPVVPGYVVSSYATGVQLPSGLSFTASGVLFVGNDDNSAGGARVTRVGVGGSPVSPYGNPFYDPDAVLVDEAGTISGTPGSIIVGGLFQESPIGAIRVIHPDETVSTLFGPTQSFINPGDLAFDMAGRMLFSDPGVDDNTRNVLVTTGASPTVLFTLPPGCATLQYRRRR